MQHGPGMASKIECTAVNELIDLVQKKPLDRDSEAELLFAPPREANLRRPDATPAGSPPHGRFAVELPLEPTEARATMPRIWTRQPEFEPTPHHGHDDDHQTAYVPRTWGHDLPAVAKRLAIPAGLIIMVSVGISAAISLSHHGRARAPLDYVAAFTPPKVVVAPPPPRAATAAPIAVRPRLVEVRLDSTPSGAAATLLDTTTGTASPLGTTPVEATLDASKHYEIRFVLEGHPAVTEHLDPSVTQRLAVAIAEPAAEPAAEPVVAAAQPHHHHHHHATRHAAKRATSHVASARGHHHGHDAVAALAALRGSHTPAKRSAAPGTLAITTTVPCAILLDGANTGKTSPARLAVPAGHHSVRLIAAAKHVNKLVAIEIAPKQTTRIHEAF